MQYGPDQVPVSNVSIVIGPPTKGPAPVPVTTTEEIIEPPIYQPLPPSSAAGNVTIPEPPPYAVAVAYENIIQTSKVLELNFDNSGLFVSTANGVSTVTNTGILDVAAGNGISAITINGVSTVINTGILTVNAGNGISAITVDGNTTVTNTGVLNVVAGNGISATTVDGNTTVTNTGVLNVVAGNSISVSTVDGNATVTNTFTETVYDGGNWTGTVTPDRNNGTIQTYTLTGNITLNLPNNMSSGQSLTLILTQDGAGNRLLSANVAYLFASGFQTLTTSAGGIDMINIFRAGSTYYATLTVGYS